MIVIRVELHSAITGLTSEIARTVIYNDGTGNNRRGNYKTFACRGRDEKALASSMRAVFARSSKPVREGEIKNHDRLGLHVWNLVVKALTAMGYDKE